MRNPPPPDDAILCEKCGYILDHLPLETNCPECGKPVRESADAVDRRLPIVERETPSIRTRLLTMLDIIVHPFTYFRSLTLASHSYQWRFRWHMMALSSLLFGLAAGLHLRWIIWFFGWGSASYSNSFEVFALMVFSGTMFISVLIFFITLVSEKLVAYFTVIEGRFWGYRLWRDVVKRVMCYHSAHLVPISFITVLIVALNLANSLTQTVRGINPKYYLYALCIWVLIASGWLMSTYVSAMRAVMFANRIPPIPPLNPSPSARDTVSTHRATVAS